MKGENLFTSYNRYYAAYEDVEGLFKSNPVMINGYKVGQVSEVQMDPKSLNLLIEIKVPNTIKVSKDATIKIVNTDLIGSKGVQVIMGSSHLIAKSGDTLKSDKDQGMAKAVANLMAPLSEKINILLGELNNQIGNDQLKKTLQSLTKTLSTVDIAVQNLEKMLVSKNGKIEGILADANEITTGLKSATPKMNSILANIDETSAELKKLEFDATIKQLKLVLGDLSATISNINQGQGTLGKMATNDDLYKKLNATLEQFKSLAADIEKYPSRYTGVTKGQRRKADKKKESEK